MDQRIKELAEQAGMHYRESCDEFCKADTDGVPFEMMERFAELIRADEREACAKVCDEKAKRDFNWASENADKYHAQASWAELCAKAIRRKD